MALSTVQKVMMRVVSISIFLYIRIESAQIPTWKHSSKLPPEIWLSEYNLQDRESDGISIDNLRVQESFADDFISKNGTNYIIQDNVQTVVIVCEAEYPIEWKFPHIEQLQNIRVSYFPTLIRGRRASKFNSDMESPASFNFRIYFQLYSSFFNFLSLNLTCQAMDNSERTRVHLKMPKNAKIEYQGETFQMDIVIKSVFEPVTVPCIPTSPDIDVNIFVKSPNETTGDTQWLLLQSREVTFNSDKGFTLFPDSSRPFVAPRHSNLYKCVLNGDDDDAVVYFNVSYVEQNQRPQSAFEPRTNLEGGATLEFVNGRFDVMDVQCCSGIANKRPVLYVVPCDNPGSCEIIKYTAPKAFKKLLNPNKRTDLKQVFDGELSSTRERSDCSNNFLFDTDESVVLFCKGENVDVAQQYVRQHSLVAWTATHKYNISSLYIPLRRDEREHATMGIEQKIVIKRGKVGSREKKGKFLRIDTSFISNRKTHIRILYVKNPANFTDSFLRQGDIDFDYANIFKSNVTQVVDFNRAVYDGELLHLMCFFSKYYYVDGGHLRLNWKNGSKTVFEKDADTKKLAYYHESGVDTVSGMESMFSPGITAALDMMSVDCFVPRWDGDQWDKHTYQMNILPSTKPRFSGKEEETVYFKLGDVGRELTCELVEGVPEPDLELAKDGHSLKAFNGVKGNQFSNLNYSAMRVETENATIILIQVMFQPITHEMHGVYQCSASNVKGTEVKTWRVIISEESSCCWWMVLVAVGVGVVACVAFLGIAIRYWLQQRK